MNIFICDDNEADIAQIRSYTKIYFAMEPYDPLVKGFTRPINTGYCFSGYRNAGTQRNKYRNRAY